MWVFSPAKISFHEISDGRQSNNDKFIYPATLCIGSLSQPSLSTHEKVHENDPFSELWLPSPSANV